MSRFGIAVHSLVGGVMFDDVAFFVAPPPLEARMSASRQRTKIKRQLKEGEEPGLNRHWRSVFLDLLAETSNVSESARRAGVNPSRAYKVRREEPEFARQ